jgi:hypothetical protein
VLRSLSCSQEGIHNLCFEPVNSAVQECLRYPRFDLHLDKRVQCCSIVISGGTMLGNPAKQDFGHLLGVPSYGVGAPIDCTVRPLVQPWRLALYVLAASHIMPRLAQECNTDQPFNSNSKRTQYSSKQGHANAQPEVTCTSLRQAMHAWLGKARYSAAATAAADGTYSCPCKPPPDSCWRACVTQHCLQRSQAQPCLLEPLS